MDKHKCRLCLRSFTNGRALGGHMRSHLLNHLNQSNSSKVNDNLDFGNEKSEIVCSRKVVQARRFRMKFEEQKSIKMLSVKSPDEEIAYCLMMLKRDSWKRGEKVEPESKLAEEKHSINSTKVRVKYKCETCFKVFKSYQALGGHRASHKKGLFAERVLRAEERGNEERSSEKTHQCPICLKCFSSGQALGGHKRTHLSGLESNNLVSSSVKKIDSMLDLNFPPPIDDADEISQIVSQS